MVSAFGQTAWMLASCQCEHPLACEPNGNPKESVEVVSRSQVHQLPPWQILADLGSDTATITAADAAKLCQATKARMARSTASRQFSHQTMPRALECRSVKCRASKAGGSGARRRKSPGWSPNCSSRSWSTSS